MNFFGKSKSSPGRSTGVLLLVGVLAGATVGGGVGVFAASSTKSVTVCANKKTNMLRYAKNGECMSKTETKVLLNQTGAPGTNGTNGAKGDTGAAGVDGTNGTLAFTQQSVCDGSDVNTIANEVCKIGMTGPGGGIIFFVDYYDQYSSLDYLEAAPVGWSNGLANVNQGGLMAETPGTATTDPKMKWCSDNTSLLGPNSWDIKAVGAGAGNTAMADTTCAGGAIQAASDYDGGSKTDWFLGSLGEMMLMNTNLLTAGAGSFASDDYWTSSELGAGVAWVQVFDTGYQYFDSKDNPSFVRPVRSF